MNVKTTEEMKEFINSSYISDLEDNYFKARKINSLNEVTKKVVKSDFPWMNCVNR